MPVDCRGTPDICLAQLHLCNSKIYDRATIGVAHSYRFGETTIRDECVLLTTSPAPFRIVKAELTDDNEEYCVPQSIGSGAYF